MFKSKVSMFLTILIILFTCTYAYGVNYYSGIPFSDTASDGDVATWGSSGKWEWITPNSGTDITVDLEEETHAADHIPSGADPVEPWLWGGALEIGDATPPIASGYVYDCTGATTITITDFYAVGSDDHTGFVSGKSRFRVWMNDEEVTVDFSANAEIEGNAGQDFTGSASDFVLLEFLYLDTGWQCTNFTSGFSNPTTLAISKAQFDYTIANPQTVSNFDTDDDFTIGTEITSSVVFLDGVATNDDNDTISLQDCGTGYDGALVTFHTLSDVDILDSITVDVETASTCINCPFAGIFKMMNVGAVLSLRCVAGTGWQFVNYSHPPTDWGAASTSTGFAADPDPATNDNIVFSVNNSIVSVLVRIVGTSNAADFTFEIPFASSASQPSSTSPALTEDNSVWGGVTLTHDTVYQYGRFVLGLTDTTVSVFPAADFVDGAWTTSGQKGVTGNFIYVVD